MDVSRIAFLCLLALVGLNRLVELRISKRNQQSMAARGAERVRDMPFLWMVLWHAGLLVAAALEVVLLRRPLIPALAVPMFAIFVVANLLRWWVIRTLGNYWNVQVMNSTSLGVVARGPYRWVRHPNYVAVFLEVIALPLIHTAWITALAVGIATILILARRISVEEKVLMASPAYLEEMGAKPRFIPGVF